MFHRITGGLLVVVGLTISAVGLRAWMHTDVMEQMSGLSYTGVFHKTFFEPALWSSHKAVFEPALWSSHWRLATLVFVGIGSSTAAAGLIVMAKKPWGYLILFGTAIFAGTYPVIIRMSGYGEYKWEGGSIRSSFPCIAVALMALFSYMVIARRKRAGVDG